MIYCFDLDDTLYREIDFVKGGFKNVASFLSPKFKTSAHLIYEQMFEVLKNQGRGKVFDSILKHYNFHKNYLIKECIQKYRYHTPAISLYPDSQKILSLKKSYPIYIITDGNKVVQKRKYNSLSLSNKVRGIFPTHQYGIDKSKPSTFCFKKIINKEKIPPSELIYFGDNTSKDFINIKKIGIRTVQLLRGPYVNLNLPAAYQADVKINDFNEYLINEKNYSWGK